MKFIIVLSILIFSINSIAISQIKINEVVSVNGSSYLDDNHDNHDWIELKNVGGKAVNLKNWRINDDENIKKAYVLPDTIIQPGEYITIFASGENRIVDNSYIIYAAGKGISDYLPETKGAFLYKELLGDFEISYRIKSMTNIDYEATAGIMFKEKLSATGKYFYSYGCSPERHHYAYSLTRKDSTFISDKENFKRQYFSMNEEFPDYRFKLKRIGDSIEVYIFVSGYKWKHKYTEYYPLSQKVYAGFAFSSYSHNQGKFIFSDMEINGKKYIPSDLDLVDWHNNAKSQIFKCRDIHTDFKISTNGETIYLWDTDNFLQSKLEVPQLRTDISYGLDIQGIPKYFDEPTVNSENSKAFTAISYTPIFSISESWHKSEINVHIKNAWSDNIYYTLNGSKPDKNSKKYNSPISIDKSSVLRVIQYNDDNIPSEIATKTYFINEPKQNINIFAVTVDSMQLWDRPSRGLLVESNLFDKLLEKECYLEYFENENDFLLFESPATIRIMGVYGARLQEQRPFKFFSRKSLGISKFKYQFFEQYGIKEYEKLSFRNSGQDFPETMMRDVIASRIAEQIGLFHSNALPISMYLNAEYWGRYFLRERIDEDLLADYYDIDEDNINVLNGTYLIKNGSWQEYDSLLTNITNCKKINDIKEYEEITKRIDTDNLIDYIILEAYAVNQDWFVTNILSWESSDYDGKYRWLPWDFDAAFGYNNHNDFHEFLYGFDNEKDQKISKLLLTLWENDIFKAKFINRTADLMNTTLNVENVLQIVDSSAKSFAPELQRHKERWATAAIDWKDKVDLLKEFIRLKPKKVYEHWIDYFKLSGSSFINIASNIDKPLLTINSIRSTAKNISFKYFNDIPIKITALDSPNNKFIRWEGDVLSISPTITITLKKNITLTAIYEKSIVNSKSIVINEIMYKASEEGDCGDWIELYNNSDKEINLSDWKIKDEKNDHQLIIPKNTFLEQDSYIVISKSMKDFNNIYPNIDNVIGEFQFGFGSEDEVRLFDANSSLVDKVAYISKTPWYSECNGEGASLELINPNQSNEVAWNWSPSKNIGGTPGRKNSTYSDISDDFFTELSNIIKICPNPVNTVSQCNIDIVENGYYELLLFDQSGKLIRQLFSNKFIHKGIQQTVLDSEDLLTGIYYLRLVNISTKKSVTESIIINK